MLLLLYFTLLYLDCLNLFDFFVFLSFFFFSIIPVSTRSKRIDNSTCAIIFCNQPLQSLFLFLYCIFFTQKITYMTFKQIIMILIILNDIIRFRGDSSHFFFSFLKILRFQKWGKNGKIPICVFCRISSTHCCVDLNGKIFCRIRSFQYHLKCTKTVSNEHLIDTTQEKTKNIPFGYFVCAKLGSVKCNSFLYL